MQQNALDTENLCVSNSTESHSIIIVGWKKLAIIRFKPIQNRFLHMIKPTDKLTKTKATTTATITTYNITQLLTPDKSYIVLLLYIEIKRWFELE